MAADWRWHSLGSNAANPATVIIQIFPGSFPALTRRPLLYRLSGSPIGLPRYLDTSASPHLICDQIPSRELWRAQEGHSDKSASGVTEGVQIQGVLGAPLSLLLWPIAYMAGSWGRGPRASLPPKLTPLQEAQHQACGSIRMQ